MCKFLELLCNLENKLFFVAGPAEEGFDEDPEGCGGVSSEVGGEGVTAEGMALDPGVDGLVLLGLRDQSSYFSAVCNFQGS